MDPLRLDRSKPRTFGGQKEGQNAHPFALLLDLLIVLADPGPFQFAHMKGGIIPDEQPGGLALRLQLLATPLQKLCGQSADRATSDEAERHLLADWIRGGALLPEDSITGQGFGVRIPLLPGLLP
jgi:hypothetical protein